MKITITIENDDGEVILDSSENYGFEAAHDTLYSQERAIKKEKDY